MIHPCLKPLTGLSGLLNNSKKDLKICWVNKIVNILGITTLLCSA